MHRMWLSPGNKPSRKYCLEVLWSALYIEGYRQRKTTMAYLKKIQKVTPNKLKNMDKDAYDEPITGSIKEIGASIGCYIK